MSYFNSFEGGTNVNLSTSTSTSSTALLSSIRAERLAREQLRRQDQAAIVIQRIWRGRKHAAETKRRLLEELEGGLIDDWRRHTGALIVVSHGRQDVESWKRIRSVLAVWCKAGMRELDSVRLKIQWLMYVERPGGLVGPAKEDPAWPVVLCIIAGHILDGIDSEPTYVDWWYSGGGG